MSIITLLTDFGIDDEYVGVMKGVILSVNPSVAIVDITHQINPQDIVQAAFIIKSSYRFFPDGTVHVTVVDPGVGSDRAIIALKIDGHIFLAPDNGILTPIFDNNEDCSIICVDNSGYFLESISQTFHGRDVFAPVAAHISKGVNIKKLGKPVDRKCLSRLSIRGPDISDTGEIKGKVISIDRFGNLITNIDASFITKHIKLCSPKIEIIMGDKIISGLSENYGSVKIGSPIAVIGSRGYLEIAVNCGSAKSYFEAKRGDTVWVR